mgnify:CR=1 FL=1
MLLVLSQNHLQTFFGFVVFHDAGAAQQKSDSAESDEVGDRELNHVRTRVRVAKGGVCAKRSEPEFRARGARLPHWIAIFIVPVRAKMRRAPAVDPFSVVIQVSFPPELRGEHGRARLAKRLDGAWTPADVSRGRVGRVEVLATINTLSVGGVIPRAKQAQRSLL